MLLKKNNRSALTLLLTLLTFLTACEENWGGLDDTYSLMKGDAIPVQTIRLSPVSLSLHIDESCLLTATITPAYATNQTLMWQSSDRSVATVFPSGLVTAMSEGTATITATATDGSGVSASCKVTVVIVSTKSVDLGLPSGTLWATCNVGAVNPEDYGDYFAWGETEGYSGEATFNWSTYKWCNGSYDSLTKYCTSSSYGMADDKTVLDPEDDAAHVQWGGSWRMPTLAEQDELRTECTWTWTQLNGVNGYRVSSKQSGNTNSIFLPAAGYRQGSGLNGVGSYGNYWSSSLNKSSLVYAYYVFFSSSSIVWNGDYRCYGQSVRPVCAGERITLSESTLTLEPGMTRTLTATVTPVDAVIDAVAWSSSDASVATVSADGVVTAVGGGTCTITCTAKDGSGVSASCEVQVVKYSHEYVDLGLPSGLLWATCNIGAENPEDYGDYFAWGETEGYNSGKTTFDWSTYKWCNGSSSTLTKYCIDSSFGTVDNKTVLDPEDDAAHVQWGGNWRMPTYDELNELKTQCTWEWTTLNGVNGYRVSSKQSRNTNSIFLPAAGCRYNSSLDDVGSAGYYWSSSLNTDYSYIACYVSFYSSSVYWYYFSRYNGWSVRPVCAE